MYKGTHRSRQRRADFIAPAEIAANGVPTVAEAQTPEDRRDNYRRAIAELEKQILCAPRNSALRRDLGLAKFRLIEEMRATCPRAPRADLGELLIDELRTMISPALWEVAMKRAEGRAAAGETKDVLQARRQARQTAQQPGSRS